MRLSTLLGMLLALNGMGQAVAAVGGHPDEAPFLAANNAVMNKMMAGMAAKPTGDVDADFVDMMEPHHRGAIGMAELELRYGRNEQLRRIAQEIIVDQQQEIATMRLAIGRSLPRSASAPTGGVEPTDAPVPGSGSGPNRQAARNENEQ